MSTKLLLADDSITIQRVVELTFSGEDVEVLAVGDGEEAIARIPAEKPDIILADIGMPKRSGYEVAAFVKGRPELEQIPVLLLAGAFEPVDETKAKEARCDGVLVKPFEPQHVIARVRELIGGKAPGVIPSPAEEPPIHEHHPGPEDVMDIGTHDVLSSDDMLPSGDAASEPDPLMLDRSLDDYFDKLDEAFATINIAARPAASPIDTPAATTERPPLMETDFGSLDGLLPQTPAEAAPRHTSDTFAALDKLSLDEVVQVPTLDELLADIPPAAGGRVIDFQSRAADPAVPAPMLDLPPVAASDRAASTPAANPTVESGGIIAEAFTALLAVESGEPGAVSPRLTINGSAPVVTDAMLDDVVQRVIQRLDLGPSSQLHAIVKEIVSNVSERLVREEIDRIRRNAPRT
jgi:CheY-like chemotaxis protein